MFTAPVSHTYFFPKFHSICPPLCLKHQGVFSEHDPPGQPGLFWVRRMSLDNVVFIQSHHPIISNPSSVLVSIEVLETNEVMIVGVKMCQLFPLRWMLSSTRGTLNQCHWMCQSLRRQIFDKWIQMIQSIPKRAERHWTYCVVQSSPSLWFSTWFCMSRLQRSGWHQLQKNSNSNASVYDHLHMNAYV